MPVNRLTAWLRPLMTLAALAAVLSLAACGGGGGSPANNSGGGTVVPLAVLPATPTVYSGTPATLSVSGGQGPYALFSSDQSALTVPVGTDGTFTIVPGSVSADTTVQVTVRDARGTIVTVPVVVKAGLLVNALTLKADNYSPQCPNDRIESTSPTDNIGSTWICSGQTGTVGVRLQNLTAGGLSGRLIEFDVIQGDFQIFTNVAGTPDTFGLSYTVPTDQNGNAVVRIRANPAASQQLVIVQAKDLASGNFVRGIYVIQQFIPGGATQLNAMPNTVTITGPDTQTCSAGAVSTFYVFGGQPPYTIGNPFPQALVVSPTIVGLNGGGFSVTTNGVCVSGATISINDAAGHTTSVSLNNNVGTNPPASTTSPNAITTTPPTLPNGAPVFTLSCGTQNALVAVGGGTVTQQGTTQTVKPATSFTIGVDRPDILSIQPSATVAAGGTISVTRLNSGTVASGGTSPQVVNVFISDGAQTLKVPVAVTNVCP